VRTSLGLRFSAKRRSIERSAEPAAFEAYLLGKRRFNEMDLDGAVSAFKEAVAIDPHFAEAYGHLAWVQTFYPWYSKRNFSDLVPEIIQHARSALEEDPNQHTALMVNAENRFFVERDFQGAIDELHNLICRNPSEVWQYTIYGAFLHTVGRSDLAVEAMQTAVSLDPLSAHAYRLLGEAHYIAGNLEEASRVLDRAEQLGAREAHLRTFIALAQDDFVAFQEQLNRPDLDWGQVPWGKYLNIGSYLHFNGDVEKARENFAIADSFNVVDRGNYRFSKAIAVGDFDSAFEELDALLASSHYLFVRDACARTQVIAQLGFCEDERYLDLLSKHNLAPESFVDIVIPGH
jgi:tetratricopeptide (TPR) repeat protein